MPKSEKEKKILKETGREMRELWALIRAGKYDAGSKKAEKLSEYLDEIEDGDLSFGDDDEED